MSWLTTALRCMHHKSSLATLQLIPKGAYIGNVPHTVFIYHTCVYYTSRGSTSTLLLVWPGDLLESEEYTKHTEYDNTIAIYVRAHLYMRNHLFGHIP